MFLDFWSAGLGATPSTSLFNTLNKALAELFRGERQYTNKYLAAGTAIFITYLSGNGFKAFMGLLQLITSFLNA